MSDSKSERLYNLLPAVHRIRDVERGEALRALLGIIEEQLRVIEKDVSGLYDDWFVETCSEWATHYIGDLLGVRMPQAIPDSTVFSLRAYVANTLSYRRRKGTLHMLEDLARDVTGWRAHAVAFFELLGWAQNLNHLRYDLAQNPNPRNPLILNPSASNRVGTVNLRSLDVVDRLDGPFDILAHTVDVRRINQLNGWHNIRNIGFFLWRLQSYPMRGVQPRVSETGGNRFYFSPLGNPAPLFNNPDRKPGETGLTKEVHVPGPIRPLAFFQEPGDYYGIESDKSFSIFLGPKVDAAAEVPISDVMCKDLSDWSPPPPGTVAVDVRLGRLVFPPGEEPAELTVSHHYGFSADLGGGPYDRRQTLGTASPGDWKVVVSKIQPSPAPSEWRSTIKDALDDWNPAVSPRAVITIADNKTYEENLSVSLSDQLHLIIQAENGNRPLLRLVDGAGQLSTLRVQGGAGENAALTLNGLLIEGAIEVQPASLGRLEVFHSTLTPGRSLNEEGKPRHPGAPSIEAASPSDELEVEIAFSITGRLKMPETMSCLSVRDSIVDSADRDAAAQRLPVLVSGNLSPFPVVTSLSPKLRVQIGEEGPHTIELDQPPGTLAQARDLLQDALRKASNSRAFRKSQVVTAGNRLLIAAGRPERIRFTNKGSDDTAAELRLDEAAAETREALLSGSLDPFPTLSSAEPALSTTIGRQGLHRAVLMPAPATLAQARDRLQSAIRDAHASDPFTQTLVAVVDSQLLVIPGRPNQRIAFAAPGDDAATLEELQLRAECPAIADGLTGDPPGPPTIIERSTVFGEIFIRTLALGSNSIFLGVVKTLRRQAGCVRFSYVREGSITPSRFRCQPDLALQEAAKRVKTTVELLPALEKDLIRARLRPDFTSDRYGNPAYGQLSLNIDPGVYTGAEDGSEMGVFSHLKQPQRESNLRGRLDEYLPYGLQAGIIFVT